MRCAGYPFAGSLAAGHGAILGYCAVLVRCRRPSSRDVCDSRCSHDVSTILRFHRSRSLATSNILHSPDHPHHAIVHLPGNESLELDLTERGLDVPRLPPALEGLSIVHLSDFHFTGKVGKPFFEEIVRMSNALEPEIVALTGDLVDKTRFIDWIPDTLGRLKARYGVYYIFGNHDLRVDWRRLRQVTGRLRADLRGRPLEGDRGPRWQSGCSLAGNELPWFKPAADLSTCPPRSEVPFRLLLAHSPDQLRLGPQGRRRPDAGRPHARRADSSAADRPGVLTQP